jgi:hypothetical protein
MARQNSLKNRRKRNERVSISSEKRVDRFHLAALNTDLSVEEYRRQISTNAFAMPIARTPLVNQDQSSQIAMNSLTGHASEFGNSFAIDYQEQRRLSASERSLRFSDPPVLPEQEQPIHSEQEQHRVSTRSMTRNRLFSDSPVSTCIQHVFKAQASLSTLTLSERRFLFRENLKNQQIIGPTTLNKADDAMYFVSDMKL